MSLWSSTLSSAPPSFASAEAEASASSTGCMFAGALVINLDRRPDRLKTFMDHYKGTDLGRVVPVERLQAIDVRRLPVSVIGSMLTPVAQAEMEEFVTTRKRRHHSQLTPGAVGCYLSHMEAWRRIAAHVSTAADSPWLVFEDDSVFRARAALGALSRFYQQSVAALEDRFGPQALTSMAFMVNFNSNCVAGCQTALSPRVHPDTVGRPYIAFGTDCYALTPRMASRLLNLTAPPLLPMDKQVDLFLYTHPGVAIAAPLTADRKPLPSLGVSGSPTDIQSSVYYPGYFFR